jgi:hypothetical protein
MSRVKFKMSRVIFKHLRAIVKVRRVLGDSSPKNEFRLFGIGLLHCKFRKNHSVVVCFMTKK